LSSSALIRLQHQVFVRFLQLSTFLLWCTLFGLLESLLHQPARRPFWVSSLSQDHAFDHA
jgi:hypothetical protein